LKRRTAALAAAFAVAAAAHAQAATLETPTPEIPTLEIPTLETAVKAAYLAKFAPFVIWPATAFPTRASPLSLCIQGDDPFGPLLDRVAAGVRVGGRALAVRRVAHLDADSNCQIAYIGGSPAQSRTAALKAVDGLPVLTVTDAGDGAGRGMVRLVLIDGRVRFLIDADRARQSGLLISSRLLSLSVGPR
jgi:hypothetical protein